MDGISSDGVDACILATFAVGDVIAESYKEAVSVRLSVAGSPSCGRSVDLGSHVV